MLANSTESMINHHRGCRGKAHASGIAKHHDASPKVVSRSPSDPPHPSSRLDNSHRKVSRNSTSSWDYSDSDSLNSFDTHNGLRRTNSGPDDGDHSKSGLKPRICKNRSDPRRHKQETWAESLRSGIIDDRYRILEDGWDDNNIISHPLDRKWKLMHDGYLRNNENLIDNRNWKCHSRKTQFGKIGRRKTMDGKISSSFCNVVEWEELLNMAMSMKIGKGRKNRGMEDFGILKDLNRMLEGSGTESDKVIWRYQVNIITCKIIY